MLVIRRREGETLVLADNIEVEILEVAGAQVKLGIRAPQSVSVLRKEIQSASTENRAAAGSADVLLARISRSHSLGKLR